MTLGSHVRIGGFIYKHFISGFSGYSAKNKRSFQIGSVLPDLRSDLSRIGHDREHSSIPMLFHLREFRDLSAPEADRFRNLGVACHYLGDFFCKYHADESYRGKSLRRHLLYEAAIEVVLFFLLLFPKRLLRSLRLPRPGSSFLLDAPASSAARDGLAFDARDVLHSLEKQYRRARAGILNDIHFALKAIALAVTFVMRSVTPTLAYCPIPAVVQAA